MMRDDPVRFDVLLRSLTTAALAFAVVGVAAWQAIAGHKLSGPFVSWAGIIIGVYFGAHIASNGAAGRRRVQDEVEFEQLKDAAQQTRQRRADD